MSLMFTLGRHQRIFIQDEFKQVIFQKDFVIRCSNYNCYVRKNQLMFNRLGVSVSKNVGKAVVRNRYKRLVREFFRLNQQQLPFGFDLVFIIKQYSRPIEHEYFDSSDRFMEIVRYFAKKNN